MRRSVRVTVDLVVELRDDGLDLGGPPRDVGSALAEVARVVIPRADAVLPGGKIRVRFTRQTSTEVRRESRRLGSGAEGRVA